MDQEHRHYCVMMFLPSLREAAAAGPSAPPTPSLRALLDAMDIQHHTDLMDAALSRDVARATTLITEHVNYKAEVFSLSHVPVRGSPPLLAT
jgi:GntR family carbon starvation induced transcriptional regulator